MPKTPAVKPPSTHIPRASKTKSQKVIDLLAYEGGATLDEMSTLAGWLPHSTRAFMTGLKKKGHVIENDKIEGVRRYRITSNGGS